jgi:hypothetical protein
MRFSQHSKKLIENNNLEDLGMDGKILIKKHSVEVWAGFIRFGVTSSDAFF